MGIGLVSRICGRILAWDSKSGLRISGWVSKQGIPAVPVHTCKELADLHRDHPTTTVDFEMRESDGWKNECFAPAWFAYDGKRVASPAPAHKLGSDAPVILAELGYSKKDIERLVAEEVVGQTEFLPVKKKG